MYTKRFDFSNKTTSNIVAQNIAKITNIVIGPIEPFFANVNKFIISLGASATIPVKIIKEPPLPIPSAVILFPSQTNINVPQSIVKAQVSLNSNELTSLTPADTNNDEIPNACANPTNIVNNFVY